MLCQQLFRDVALVLRGAEVPGTPEAYSSFWELIAINIDEVYLNLFKVYLSCTNQSCRGRIKPIKLVHGMLVHIITFT